MSLTNTVPMAAVEPAFELLVKPNTVLKSLEVPHGHLHTRKKQKIIRRLGEIITVGGQQNNNNNNNNRGSGNSENNNNNNNAGRWELQNVPHPFLMNMSYCKWSSANRSNLAMTTKTQQDHHSPIYHYTDEEYRLLCSSRDWTRDETDCLMKLCEELNLRWAVIVDRYNAQVQVIKQEQEQEKPQDFDMEYIYTTHHNSNHNNSNSNSNNNYNHTHTHNGQENKYEQEQGQEHKDNKLGWLNQSRTLEEIKERYYSIQNALKRHHLRQWNSQNSHLSNTFDYEKEMDLIEYDRKRDERRRQELQKIQMRSYEEERELCDAIEHQRRTEIKLKREIEEAKKRYEEQMIQRQWIEAKMNNKNKMKQITNKLTSNIIDGGIVGQNIGYGVIVQDNTRPTINANESNGGPLHGLPKGVVPLGPHYVKKYLTATHLDIMAKRVYTIEIENEKYNVLFPFKEPTTTTTTTTNTSTTTTTAATTSTITATTVNGSSHSIRKNSVSPDLLQDHNADADGSGADIDVDGDIDADLDTIMKDNEKNTEHHENEKEREKDKEKTSHPLSIPERIAKKVQNHLIDWDILRDADLALNGSATCVTHSMFHTLRGDLVKYYTLQEAFRKKLALAKQRLPSDVWKQLLR